MRLELFYNDFQFYKLVEILLLMPLNNNTKSFQVFRQTDTAWYEFLDTMPLNL